MLTDKQQQFINQLSSDELELFTADFIDVVDELIESWSK
jgi:hypothetical protein